MSEGFQLFAEPWWVNLLIAVPFLAWWLSRKDGLSITKKTLLIALVFGAAFGFVEASVVVYLRAAIGLSANIYQQAQVLANLPQNLVIVEIFREAATMLMLLSVAFLAAKGRRERWALFLWTFAVWDIFYYMGLFATIRWPSSLFSPDVLFLIPVPWLAQVWFPLLVSALTIGAVLLSAKDDVIK